MAMATSRSSRAARSNSACTRCPTAGNRVLDRIDARGHRSAARVEIAREPAQRDWFISRARPRAAYQQWNQKPQL